GDVLSKPPDVLEGVTLTPRLRQTLSCLLGGDSEKQIALKLQISQHTVHTYVKNLHRRFSVNSRGELLAKFVNVRSSTPRAFDESPDQVS
ncbi:MAG: helix-turn-helix transcriptional regulator, partial [Tepidisphaeraceae bacterium]